MIDIKNVHLFLLVTTFLSKTFELIFIHSPLQIVALPVIHKVNITANIYRWSTQTHQEKTNSTYFGSFLIKPRT